MEKSESIARKIRSDQVGVIPTDTIYGVAAAAFSKKAVARTYKILKRNPKKPFIVLIGSIEDLSLFNIKLDHTTENVLRNIWPGKVSVVLPVRGRKFEYLHRGTKTLAFRLPKKKNLLKILKKTGPLISTSANPEGAKPAETIMESRNYFGDHIDFFASGGKIKSLPSTLIEIKDGNINVLRRGGGKISLIKTKH
jgi:L-threonylcarbamoyladenylate synthase